MSEYIVNIDESNASALLIEESSKRPVVVDFWAEWCEPCKVLMPMLEKIAHEYQGAFLLAKVNADEQQAESKRDGIEAMTDHEITLPNRIRRHLARRHRQPPSRNRRVS